MTFYGLHLSFVRELKFYQMFWYCVWLTSEAGFNTVCFRKSHLFLLFPQCHLGIPVLPHRWSVGIPLETQSRSQSCAFGPWSTFCDKGGISGHKLRFWSEGCRLGLRELLMGPPNRSDLKLVSEKDFQGHKPVAFCVASASSLQQAQLCVLIRPTFSVTLFSSVSVADLPLRTYML